MHTDLKTSTADPPLVLLG